MADANARWLGRRPTGWQLETLQGALERIDGPGSPFAYDQVIVIVGRRCGKTVITFGVPHARALAGPVMLPNGRRVPFRATHTAQNLTAARERFTKDLVEPYQRHFTDLDWKRAADFKRAAADTTLTLDPRRGRSRKNVQEAVARGVASELRVLAPSPSAARGSGLLHLTNDEYLTQTLERGKELQDAARPTMSEMHGHAQSWTVSNISLGTDSRMHLWHLRQLGRKAVEDGRREGIYYREYSLPPGEDPDDESNWWHYYPALSDGIVGIRQLRRDRETLGRAAFAAEYLTRWPDENDTGVAGWAAVGLEDWLAAGVDEELPAETPAAIGVEIDPYNRSSTIVAATAGTEAGTVATEVIDHRPGSEWVRAAVLGLAGQVAGICVDDYGPGHDLLDTLTTAEAVQERLVTTRGQDLTAACFALDAALRDHSVTWRKSTHQDALTAAAAAAERTSGRAWQWERRVSVSQSPLMGMTLALWGLRHLPEAVADSEIY